MRLPEGVLSVLRSPVLVAALASCAVRSPPMRIEPEPLPPPSVLAPVAAEVEPVGYDVDAEARRLEVLDAAGALAVAERSRRIENGERAARRARAARAYSQTLDFVVIGCGRG